MEFRNTKINLSWINERAATDPAAFVAEEEAAYRKEMLDIADEILSNGVCKIVMLAGPSSSGKTTSAYMLKAEFIKRGIKSAVVSLDDFYGGGHELPKLENGEPNFESIYALDLDEIERCFSEIIKHGKSNIPVFDFMNGKRSEKTYPLDVTNGIVIVEGLHALNPILISKLESACVKKIYVSVNTKIFGDNGKKLLSSRQLRLIRRLSRDFIYRNSSAENTLNLWTAVTQGEEKNLNCYKDSADINVITLHAYEPCIFREIILVMLENLDESSDNYKYAIAVREALKAFVSLSPDIVPSTSLIREFLK